MRWFASVQSCLLLIVLREEQQAERRETTFSCLKCTKRCREISILKSFSFSLSHQTLFSKDMINTACHPSTYREWWKSKSLENENILFMGHQQNLDTRHCQLFNTHHCPLHTHQLFRKAAVWHTGCWTLNAPSVCMRCLQCATGINWSTSNDAMLSMLKDIFWKVRTGRRVLPSLEL